MTTSLYYNPFVPAYSNIGVPIAEAYLYLYYTSTSTLAPIFSDAAGTVPLTNPVQANLAGKYPAIYLQDGVTYRVHQTDKAGVTIGDDIDPYYPGTVIAASDPSLRPDVDKLSLATIAALRTSPYATLTDRRSALVQGYYASGDWGGGEFYWDSASVLTDNGGTVINPTGNAGAGRWRRITNGPLSILAFGAVPDGVTAGNGAKINAAIATGIKNIYAPEGNYLIDADIVVVDYLIFRGGGNTQFLASANGRTFFKSTTHAYFAEIHKINFNGNGKSSVVGFDMTQFREGGAGVYDCHYYQCANGFIARDGCFGTVVSNNSSFSTPNPVRVIANAASLLILHPMFDNYTGSTGLGIGVQIDANASANVGVQIIGGFIQGFAQGVQDSGVGTKITDTYFEVCTFADIYGLNARNGVYSGTTHPATGGPCAVKLSGCDAMTILWPTMPSGSRTALYDVPTGNTNCVEIHSDSSASYNSPTGSLAFLGRLAVQTFGTFTPVIAGSTVAGAGTYTAQDGKWSKTGNVVHFDLTVTWTAHTGTGSIVVTGLPAALAPAAFSPQRAFTLVPSGVAFTGPLLFSILNGTSTNISAQQATAAGVVSLVPIVGTGTISITGSYEL